jgi:excisionase family DNA binding protein
MAQNKQDFTRRISISEAAERAGVATKTIRRRIADGTLTAYRLGPRLIRLDLAELDAAFVQIPTVQRDQS